MEQTLVHVPLFKKKHRSFKQVHDELMETNPEYRAAWLEETRKGDDLGFLHHEFMTNEQFSYDYESKHDTRKDCLKQHLQEWRKFSGVSIDIIADRMAIAPSYVHRIERNPLAASVNTIARYAHACGLKVSFEKI